MQWFVMPSSFGWYIVVSEGYHVTVQYMADQVLEFLSIDSLG